MSEHIKEETTTKLLGHTHSRTHIFSSVACNSYFLQKVAKKYKCMQGRNVHVNVLAGPTRLIRLTVRSAPEYRSQKSYAIECLKNSHYFRNFPNVIT
jgi:hypothetical protein